MANCMIDTYFRIDGAFVRVSEFSGSMPDSDYLEGAIVCTIDGRGLLGLEHWDLVDQLWAYIVNGLIVLDQENHFTCCFPDQALRLRFDKIGQDLVRVTVGDESHEVESAALRSVLKQGAMDFFSVMKAVHPAASETWDEYLSKANTL